MVIDIHIIICAHIFLQSPRRDGVELATTRYSAENLGRPDEDDAFAIAYTFGNRDILLKYITKYPEGTKIALIRSFAILPIGETIMLFPRNECLTEEEWHAWVDYALYYTGYDYLLQWVKTNVLKCGEEDDST